jgi:hypothetical protein
VATLQPLWFVLLLTNKPEATKAGAEYPCSPQLAHSAHGHSAHISIAADSSRALLLLPVWLLSPALPITGAAGSLLLLLLLLLRLSQAQT